MGYLASATMTGMNDTQQPSDSHNSHGSHDSRPTVTVKEAADLLGTTVDAVRSRLNRGALEGEKVGNTWRVRLPDDIVQDRDATEATADRQSVTAGDSRANDVLVEHLQGEVAYLRERLEEAERERERVLQRMADERERFDIIHRTALDRIEALAATVSSTDEAVESPQSDETDDQARDQREEAEPPASAWARLWRRIAGER